MYVKLVISCFIMLVALQVFQVQLMHGNKAEWKPEDVISEANAGMVPAYDHIQVARQRATSAMNTQ